MLRAFFAFLLGVIVMMGVITGLQMLGHHWWPLPEGIDPRDPAQLAGIVESIPVIAKAWIVLVYVIATAVGVLVATAIARPKWKGLGWALGGLMVALCAINLTMLPHPLWMAIATLVLPLPVALGVARWRRPSAG